MPSCAQSPLCPMCPAQDPAGAPSRAPGRTLAKAQTETWKGSPQQKQLPGRCNPRILAQRCPGNRNKGPQAGRLSPQKWVCPLRAPQPPSVPAPAVTWPSLMTSDLPPALTRTL